MDSSAARMARMYSYISPPSRPADSAVCRKVSKYSLTWSKAPRAGKLRTSRASNPSRSKTNKGGQQWPPFIFFRYSSRNCDPERSEAQPNQFERPWVPLLFPFLLISNEYNIRICVSPNHSEFLAVEGPMKCTNVFCPEFR